MKQYNDILKYSLSDPLPVKLDVDISFTFVTFTFDSESPTRNHELIIFDNDEKKCKKKVQFLKYHGDPTLPTCDDSCSVDTIVLYGNRYYDTGIECGQYTATLYARNEGRCSNASIEEYTIKQMGMYE